MLNPYCKADWENLCPTYDQLDPDGGLPDAGLP
jgi:hypothetical protein